MRKFIKREGYEKNFSERVMEEVSLWIPEFGIEWRKVFRDKEVLENLPVGSYYFSGKVNVSPSEVVMEKKGNYVTIYIVMEGHKTKYLIVPNRRKK